ncbi:hypothetical protein FQN49_003171 [Arthroderma sp. PD_2]|nr:hypothetical protein FQN49_003171 [Arthroderma sp. PD_2]
MDPFSVSVGVIGLVGFVGTTISLTSSYLSGVKNSKSSAAALLTELEALKSSLLGLDKLIHNEKLTKNLVFKQTSALQSCMLSCEVKLKSLCSKLDNVGESRRSRYLWPLSEKETQKTLQDLRTLTQWIQFALSVDGLSLLSRTSDDVLEVLERQTESFRVLKKLERKTAQLQETVEDQSLLLQEDRNNKKRQDILDWVSRLDQTQKHDNLRSPRLDGTGGWLLERPEYKRWRDDVSSSNVLWCHGVQGSGKTVLTTMVIDKIKSSVSDHEALAFHYFDYQEQDRQTPSSVLSSILRQILAMIPSIPQCVADAYHKVNGSSFPIPLHELEKLILGVTHDIRRTYIIIDALDECSESTHRKPVLSFLDQILKQNQTVRLFVTSRPFPHDIKAIFQAQPQVLIQAHESDLRQYLYREIDLAGIQDVVDHSFATKIVDTLVSKAEGMFLLAVLQIRTILAQPTAGDIEDALSSLSQTLPGAFEETISRVEKLPESRRGLGMRILMWICHAKREMTVTELSDALSVRGDHKTMNPMYRPSPRIMEACCQGLVAIDQHTKTVRLAHYAIQEYLIGRSDQLFLEAEASLAEVCLTYLLFDTFQQGPLPNRAGIESRMESHPFLSYASIYWGLHAQQSESRPTVQRLVSEFFSSQNAIACANQIMRYVGSYRKLYWEPGECYSTTALHVASHFGLENALHKLLDENNVFVDTPTKMGTTALIKAASRGHVSVLRDLLKRGADPYLENWYGNALHCAAEAGKSHVIKELIHHGMSANGYQQGGQTPIRCTLNHDHAAAFETLVDFGAEIELKHDDKNSLSVFHMAVVDDSVNIVHLILDRQLVDPNCRSRNGNTAVHYAVKMRNTMMLRMLIEAGADIDVRDNMGQRPLDYTNRKGDADIRRLLLKHGAIS